MTNKMTEESIAEYLTSLGLGAPLVTRGQEVVDFYAGLVKESPLHVFVSDYRDE
jgi:hypothetical protein